MKTQREPVEGLLNKAEQAADAEHRKLVDDARAQLRAELEEEIDRLKALQQVNPLVRDDEIKALQLRLADGDLALAQAKLRLDAIRVLVAG